MATCKACGEEILFIETPRGKYLPVDADSLGVHDLASETVVTPQGIVIKGGYGSGQVQGYTPHFATCPFADQFRKAPGGA